MNLKMTIFATMFKKIFIGVLFASSFVRVWGQGKVTIIAEDIVEKAENARIQGRKSGEQTVQGFRILIGIKTTRAEANKLQTEAQEQFADNFTAHVIYDEPNFKIYAGAYTNSTDCDEALAEIRKFYPNAKKIKMPVKTQKK